MEGQELVHVTFIRLSETGGVMASPLLLPPVRARTPVCLGQGQPSGLRLSWHMASGFHVFRGKRCNFVAACQAVLFQNVGAPC